MRRGTLLGCVTAFGIVSTGGLARADDASLTPIALSYEATPAAACPGADSFRESVEKRAPHGRIVVDGSSNGGSGIRARVEVQARQGREARAHVTVMAGDRVVAERDVVGRSCTEIAQASALLVALFAEAEAPAEEPPQDPQPAAPEPTKPLVAPPAPNRDASASAPEASRLRQLAIFANPLALAVNRYSAQLEYLPVTHHAFTVNPFFFKANRKHTEDGVAYDLGDQNGLGAELGYRYYTGTKGPNGFFFGPSLLFGAYWANGGEPNAPEGLLTSRPEAYTAFGGAIDLGGQVVVSPGIVLGAGAGVQYLTTTAQRPDINTVFEGRGGISPRLLASLGYAF
jgi:hypothetical protein